MQHEFLEPMGITAYRLAKEIGFSQIRISQIFSSKRAVTADTGLRLSRCFGLNDNFWTGLQLDYDAAITKSEMAKSLRQIPPLQAA